MFKLTCTLCAITLILPHSQAQNIWGAEAVVGQSEGQFATDFIETGDPNNLSTVSWTALSVNDTGGSRVPGDAYWTRNLEGYSQGAYWSGTEPVLSPSQNNGIGLFDSDYLDNNGVQGDFGLGTSPSAHKGELISPIINLSGYMDTVIGIKFYSYYRDFQISELSLSISTDDGLTWSPAIDYRTEQPGITEGFISIDLPADTLAGIANLTACRIKFTFDGDYYFALIDDVTILVSDLIFNGGFEALN